jgi:hypothetical protein
MPSLLRDTRIPLSATILLAVGGCTLNQQSLGFVGVELARLIADTLANAFQVFVQATA